MRKLPGKSGAVHSVISPRCRYYIQEKDKRRGPFMQQMETLPSGTILYGRYRVERALGSGGFGHVYLCIDIQNQQLYAIKEYLVTGISGKAQLEHEVQV